MTDRHAGYVVTLAADIREDDANAIITALKMIKGVVSVEPIDASPDVVVATTRIRGEFREKFWTFYQTL